MFMDLEKGTWILKYVHKFTKNVQMFCKNKKEKRKRKIKNQSKTVQETGSKTKENIQTNQTGKPRRFFKLVRKISYTGCQRRYYGMRM